MDLILEMATAAGSLSSFSSSGSAAETIPAVTTAATTVVTMTAAADADDRIRIRIFLTDNAEEPICCGRSALFHKKNAPAYLAAERFFVHFLHLP